MSNHEQTSIVKLADKIYCLDTVFCLLWNSVITGEGSFVQNLCKLNKIVSNNTPSTLAPL